MIEVRITLAISLDVWFDAENTEYSEYIDDGEDELSVKDDADSKVMDDADNTGLKVSWELGPIVVEDVVTESEPGIELVSSTDTELSEIDPVDVAVLALRSPGLDALLKLEERLVHDPVSESVLVNETRVWLVSL